MVSRRASGFGMAAAGAVALGVALAHALGLRVPGIGGLTALGLGGIGVALLGAARNVRRGLGAASPVTPVHAFARGDDELAAEIAAQAAADRAQLEQLAAQGIDTAQVQPVVLHFTVARAELAHELAQRLEQEHGGRAAVHAPPGAGITTVDLATTAAPAELARPERVAARVQLAARHFAEHDGWSVPPAGERSR